MYLQFRHHGYRQRYRLADQTRILNYKVMSLLSKAACSLTFCKLKDIKNGKFFYYSRNKSKRLQNGKSTNKEQGGRQARSALFPRVDE